MLVATAMVSHTHQSAGKKLATLSSARVLRIATLTLKKKRLAYRL